MCDRMIALVPAGGNPVRLTSNLDTAEVIVPPELTISRVIVAKPVTPVSAGFTTTGATSLPASNWAVKMRVLAWAWTDRATIIAIETTAIATRRTGAISFFIFLLLDSFLAVADDANGMNYNA
jgi:hypothetical protein